MVTPIHSDYSIDSESVERIIHTFKVNQCAPFALGTTGESASLKQQQKLALIKSVVQSTDGQMPVFAGISSTSLLEAIDMGKQFSDLGAEVLVATLPYYYPISPDEMTLFFEQLADEVDRPVILYNMPSLVRHSIPLEVAERLSHHPNIQGMKDSERDAQRITDSIRLWKDREDFAFYLGWAAKSAHSVLQGADGIVPSTANFVPDLYQQLYQAALDGQEDLAFRLQQVTDDFSLIYQRNRPLNSSLPALKVLMHELGLCETEVLPPLYHIVQDEQLQLISELRALMENMSG